MKSISPRPIFRLSFFTAANLKIAHFLAFSTQTHQNPSSSYHPRRQDEESRSVRVSVWWDFENCNLPINVNAFRVAQSITDAVRANGIKGPINITAFGDVMQISRTNQEALSSTGINITHVPTGGKNSADRSLLVDLMYWVSQNPPPAHLFLISGDRDFAGILHRLRMSNYNILLASPDSAPNVLCSAATIMWQWSSLLKGENLTGKLFNQPPDGPYNSWYGHYKAPRENPFEVTEQPSCLGPLGADGSPEIAPEIKVRPIPKAVMKHIGQILRSYPEGIYITQLRAEIAKSLTLDKDLYGYKKFSRFLFAMPHVLKLHSGSDGQYVVRRVCTNKKSLDESVPAGYVESGTDNEEPELGFVSKAYGERISEKSTVNPVPDPKLEVESTNLQEARREEKQKGSSLSMKTADIKTKVHAANQQNLKKDEKQKVSHPMKDTQEIHEKDRKAKLREQPQKVEAASSVVDTNDFPEKNENQLLVPNDLSSFYGFGIFKRIWMKWFGGRVTGTSNKNCQKRDELLSEKDIVIEEALKSGQSSESIHPASSPSNAKAPVDGKISQSGDAVSGISSQDPSFLNQTMGWFKSRSSRESDDKVEKNGETTDESKVNGKQLQIFAEESFWKEIESFIDSSQASAAFSKSRTREQLVENLQKQGPQVLRSLSESDLLHLVELLISDKKWVEECVYWTFPFRLTRPTGKDPLDHVRSSSNGLSHIFAGRQPNLQESKDRQRQSPPHTGVPLPRGSSRKSKSEQLADCQKFVDQIVKEYPQGFNIRGFAKLFLEKHGYALDLRKLGYEKLVNLLQVMPGVRIESNLILPAEESMNLDPQKTNLPIEESKVSLAVDSHGDSSVLSTKDDDSDSWEELGPVDNSGTKNDEINTILSEKRPKGRMGQRLPDYEPAEDDDFSDSEEEISSPSSEIESKSKLKEEESSLLQILGAWNNEERGDGKKDESTNVIENDETVSEASTPTKLITKNESPAGKPPRKQKHVKSYSFVADQPADRQDKMVTGILGCLNKSPEKSDDPKVLG